MEGTVKWFNSTKGYGFITGEDGTDYFAHFGEIQMDGFKKLEENQTVTFEVGEGEKGPVAKDIKSAQIKEYIFTMITKKNEPKVRSFLLYNLTI